MKIIDSKLRYTVSLGTLAMLTAFSFHARSDTRATALGNARVAAMPQSQGAVAATGSLERFIRIHRSVTVWHIGYPAGTAACCSYAAAEPRL